MSDEEKKICTFFGRHFMKVVFTVVVVVGVDNDVACVANKVAFCTFLGGIL